MVRCPCGYEMRVPEGPDADDATYDFVGEGEKTVASESVAAVSPAPAKVGVPILGYRTPPKGTLSGKGGLVDTETLKNQHIPLWLLGGGVVVESIAAFLAYGGDLSRVMGHIFGEIIGGTILMLVGVMLAAKFRGIQIGSFRSAILKLAAISVAPAAVGDLLFPITVLIPYLGWIQVLIVRFVLYFALLGALFDLEESDTWYFVKVIFLIDVGFFALVHWVPWHG